MSDSVCGPSGNESANRIVDELELRGNDDELADDISYLAPFPQEATARDLRLTARGWRNLIKGASLPREKSYQGVLSDRSIACSSQRYGW
jgi:hypothetical protein